MGNAGAELLALTDPTLFALPHRQGFSGLAWLRIPPPPTSAFEWSEDLRFWQLSTQLLGATFGNPRQTDSVRSLVSPPRPGSALITAVAGPQMAQRKSRLRLEDGLAGRTLIALIEVPAQPHNDLLTPSVVQVLVDAEGQIVSVPVLLPPGSGSPDADKEALRLARTARFNSIASSGPGRATNSTGQLTWGRMIFEWQTVPKE
jgi:TonB family protein